MNLHAAGLRTTGHGMEVGLMSDVRSPWSLPERPDLEQLRKQAKELRDSEHHPTLTEAQFSLARHYGFASWTKLKLAVELIGLRNAIHDRDGKRVAELLDESPSLTSERFDDGTTPLHEAAEVNQPDIVELLVTRGAAFSATFGNSAHSALSWALTVESLDAAKKLVELGNEPDLFCAAGLGDLDRVKAFWDGGRLRVSPSRTGASRTDETGAPLPRPPKDDLDQVSDALYIAARLGHIDVTRWLLDHGADPNWRGYCGATPLAWAEFSGKAELSALLRERGSSGDLLDYTYRATPRVFPLFVFADWGFPRRLRDRLTANPSFVRARAGIGTLLHAAAAGGQTVCAQILIRFGVDRDALDADGRTAADVAAMRGHAELATLLWDGLR
jgi:ankyrin repeat protein